MTLRTVLPAAMGLALAASVFISPASAQVKNLKVGDPAPGLDIEKWVKNGETKIEEGNVYIVEFWATWCGPCKRAIPHLTELQKELGEDGLTIIGVSTEEVGLVEKFVKSQGSKMEYTVAVDRQQGTSRAWFDAAGLKGIPASFIVDRKGKIAYIGNPHQEDFEPTLRQVMTGRFNPKLQAQAKPILKAANDARKMRNWRMATLHYNEVLALDPTIFVDAGLEHYEMLLLDMDSAESASTFVRDELLNKHFAADAGALQMLAEKMATDPKIDATKRDLDLALEVAQAARRVAGENDPRAMAVEANIHFQRGELAQAIDLQKSAYFNAAPKKKAEYKRMLSTYQQAGDRVVGGRKP